MLLLTSGCKSAPAKYTLLLFGVPVKSFQKQNKAILTLYKPLFIVHVRVEGLFKVILEYKNEVPQFEKWVWHVHNEIV